MDEGVRGGSCSPTPWVLPIEDQSDDLHGGVPTTEGYSQVDATIAQTITEMRIVCRWDIAANQAPWVKMARGLCTKHMRGPVGASTRVLPVGLALATYNAKWDQV